MLNHEPSLNPPEDEKLERISDYVSDLTLEDMAIEIYNYGLDERVKEMIVENHNMNDLMQEVIQESNLEFLIQLIAKKYVDEIREILIDYLYWKDQSWAS
jgi:Asp-tRNA(Asn)/Glu-tRNA(Gln) amidotransferase B subunit